jgi:hypothetical protein
MEFIWLIPNDDNRLEDGKDLRYEFLDEEGIDEVDPDWMSLGCSVLEMMLGLSRRLSFEAEGKPRDWFWHLIENLGLTHLNDKDYDDRTRELVDETFGRVIFRLYERNGQGGLFPLRHPKENQQNVELWYQLSAYLLENELTRGG